MEQTNKPIKNIFYYEGEEQGQNINGCVAIRNNILIEVKETKEFIIRKWEMLEL